MLPVASPAVPEDDSTVEELLGVHAEGVHLGAVQPKPVQPEGDPCGVTRSEAGVGSGWKFRATLKCLFEFRSLINGEGAHCLARLSSPTGPSPGWRLLK